MSEFNSDLIRGNLVSCWKVGLRLNWSHSRIASMFPMDGSAISRLTDEEEEKIDAYLLRFSNMVTIIQDSIFKAVLILEAENPSNKSARDKTNLMEKFGAISSAVDFSSMAVLRNKLSHSYPNDSEKQAELVSLAWTSGRDIIALFNGILEYIIAKNLIADLDVLTI